MHSKQIGFPNFTTKKKNEKAHAHKKLFFLNEMFYTFFTIINYYSNNLHIFCCIEENKKKINQTSYSTKEENKYQWPNKIVF